VKQLELMTEFGEYLFSVYKETHKLGDNIFDDLLNFNKWIGDRTMDELSSYLNGYTGTV